MNYFETTFEAQSGVPYHLWVRLKAQNNYFANDSVYVQFSDAQDASKAAIYRINTTTAATVVLQEVDNGPISGWGWADQGWNGNGINIYFAASGTHTIRVQQREDGAMIDQIILSPNGTSPRRREHRTATPPSCPGDRAECRRRLRDRRRSLRVAEVSAVTGARVPQATVCVTVAQPRRNRRNS